jgi:hypothetical protein
MYAGLRVLQIVIEVLGKSLDSRLTGVVCCVPGRIGNTLLTTCDDDGRRFARRARLE